MSIFNKKEEEVVEEKTTDEIVKEALKPVIDGSDTKNWSGHPDGELDYMYAK